jgi:hypothetical protein
LAEAANEAPTTTPPRPGGGILIVVLALAAGLGVGLLVLPRGRDDSDPDAAARYAEMIRGAALCLQGADVDRGRHLLAACPERLRGWEWDYLNSIGPEADGFPAVRLKVTVDGMGFTAESDPGAPPPPPEVLKTSALLEATGSGAPPPAVEGAPEHLTVSGFGTPELTLAREGRPPVVLRGHTGPVASAAFTPDGRRVATASSDGTIRIWQPETGAELLSLPGPAEPRRTWFSPDGSLLFAAAQGAALIYVARPWSGVVAPQ